MNVLERNQAARYYVNAKLGHVSQMEESDFSSIVGYTKISEILTNLIDVNAKGFRGVALTAIVGMELNPEFDPLNRFYDCNPRAIFEDGIWYALSENNVPCGKSDPLNVAKNTYELNESWAEGKRPASAALAAVHFLRLIVQAEGADRERLIDFFFYRLFEFAGRNAAINLGVSEDPGESRQLIVSRLVRFALTHPESGMVPQMLVALLLTKLFEMSDIQVVGADESVFGTNTTSKKPADIWTELAGEPLCLFEVTVKPVNEKRLLDVIDSLSAVNQITKPLVFICRIPQDTMELQLDNSSVFFHGKSIEFVDITQFAAAVSAVLRPEQLSDVVEELQARVSDVNVSMRTRQGWNNIMNQEPSL